MQSPIYLEVCAGLTNRMRATVSGICAAEDLGRPIVISWPKEYGFGARVTDLFDLSTLPSWISFSDTRLYKLQSCLSPEDWAKLCNQETIAIKSYGQFHQSDPARWLSWLRRLRPRKEFVDAIVVRAPTVGIHIRRTDNTVSIEKSPTEVFIHAIKAYPADTQFFLATDDPKEYDTISMKIPDRKFLRACLIPDRNTQVGIEEAFLDFLCLASCTEILGSAGSSFSEMAAAFGAINLNTLSRTVA